MDPIWLSATLRFNNMHGIKVYNHNNSYSGASELRTLVLVLSFVGGLSSTWGFKNILVLYQRFHCMDSGRGDSEPASPFLVVFTSLMLFPFFVSTPLIDCIKLSAQFFFNGLLLLFLSSFFGLSSFFWSPCIAKPALFLHLLFIHHRPNLPWPQFIEHAINPQLPNQITLTFLAFIPETLLELLLSAVAEFGLCKINRQTYRKL